MFVSSGSVAGQKSIEEAFAAAITPPVTPLENSAGDTVTAKLFVCPNGAADALELVQRVPKGARFIVSLDLDFKDDTPLSPGQIELIKTAFEKTPEASAHGVSDASAARLEQLKSHNVHVDIDHIDADECCALPPDILALGKREKILLLAHHDTNMIQDANQAQLQKLTGVDPKNWKAVQRITTKYGGRQVIASTDYTVLA